jgi:hypothetical protein
LVCFVSQNGLFVTHSPQFVKMPLSYPCPFDSFLYICHQITIQKNSNNMKRFYSLMISLLALVAVATETKAADVSLTPDGSGGYYVKLVKNTTSTLTLDGTVSTFKVYDDGGASGYMTSGSHNDYLVINVPTGYKLRVDGYMRAKSTVTLYDGNSTSAPVLAGPLSPSSGYYCKIYATSTGNSIMVRLYDIYASSDYDGLDLTVTLLLDEKRTPLTLEAVDDETTINILNPNGLTIEYNKNGGEWVPSDANPISISVNANDKVQLRGNNSCYWGTGDSGETPTRITATGRCYIYGNVMSLVHASDFATNSTLTEEFALAYLFAAPSDDPLSSMTTIRPCSVTARMSWHCLPPACRGVATCICLPAVRH